MADVVLTTESVPPTPASGATTLFTTTSMPGPFSSQQALGSTSATQWGGAAGETNPVGISAQVAGQGVMAFGPRELAFVTDAGTARIVRKLTNNSAVGTTSSAAETILNGSRIICPGHGLKIGTIFRWRFIVVKTAAGIAAGIWKVYIGVNGSTSDTNVLTFTTTAQTAVVDTGMVEIVVVVRSVGSAGVVAGAMNMLHGQGASQITGLASQGGTVLSPGAGTAADMTRIPLIVCVSMNSGSSGSWSTNTQTAEIMEAVNL